MLYSFSEPYTNVVLLLKTLCKCCTPSQKPYISVILLLKTLYKCCTPSQNIIQMLYSSQKPYLSVVLLLKTLYISVLLFLKNHIKHY